MSEPPDHAAETVDPLLLAFLAGRDGLCPLCGYNLRDARTDRCPECGEQFVLGLRASEPKLGWTITGLVGLSAGFGFSVLLMFYFAYMIVFFRNGQPPHFWRMFWFYVTVPAVVQAALIFLWLTRWNRIRRLPDGSRVFLALAACSIPLINLVLFTKNVR